MAAFRSAWGLGDLGDRARRPPASIARARQMFALANAASSGTGDVLGDAGLGAGLTVEEATCSLDAIVEAEIRNSSRPGSQAPHAPPALTFGLPGKQRVNSVPAGNDLARLLSTLPDISKDLAIHQALAGQARPGLPPSSVRRGATLACALPPGRSVLSGNRRTRCPQP